MNKPSSADILDTFWGTMVRLVINARWECGKQREISRARPAGSRILMGDDVVEEGKWPWMAYLYHPQEGRVDGFFCGGTLIDTEWVMTAAHCIKYYSEPLKYRIILGERNIRDMSGNEKDYGVSKIVMHPHFKETTFQNDVALLKLSSPVLFSEFIRPACLPPNGFETDADEGSSSLAGGNCTVLGWGRTETKMKTDILKSATLTIMPRVLCNDMTKTKYVSRVSFSSPQFCAFGQNGEDTCTADSGGPLLCIQENKYYLHGVTSYGPKDKVCAGSEKPTIYGQVSKFRDWISLNILQG